MMRRRLTLAITAGSLVMIIVLTVSYAQAHGVGYQEIPADGCKAVECAYSSGEPMAYAKVLVFGPGDEEVEYQNGRTDRLGRFAFIPDEPGEWRIEANDGQGHKVTARIQVAGNSTSGENAAAKPVKKGATKPGTDIPIPVAALLGVSLIVNVFFGLHYFKKRRSA